MARLTARITKQGIIIDAIWVTASKPRLETLQQNGLPTPEPQRVKALIDTGSSCSSLDKSVLEKLALPTTGFIHLYTASTGNTPIEARQFDVSLWLQTSQFEPLILAVPVTEADFAGQTFDCLLGMDILQRCIFHLDGPSETAYLNFN